MLLTGFLTAGAPFTVYLYVLKTRTPEMERAAAFAMLVFAERLRSFGTRSEIKLVWCISSFTNVPLLVVLAVSFFIQVWSQHSATLGGFLKSSFMPFIDCLLLVAVGAIPLLILEIRKVVRNALSLPAHMLH